MRGFRRTLSILLVFSAPSRATLSPGAEGGRALYLPMLTREAAALGLPPALADAVAMVETGYRPDAVGSSGEIGLMQVMPATALQLGFHGTLAELAEPATNIHLGVTYLARAWAASGGDVCRTLTKYRAGLGQEVMTPLSVGYCRRALAWLSSTGSALAGTAAVRDATALPPPAPDPYVIAIRPVLAAQASLNPLLATPHELSPSFRGHRLMADQTRALNDRFLSHQRHYGPFPRARQSVGED